MTTIPSLDSIPVRFWQPEDGRVFDKPYSFDTETALIDTERPWIIPPLVVVGVFDGETAYLLTRKTVSEFLRLHADLRVVMHNAAFDLAVIHQAINRDFDVYGLVDQGLVRDTQILHRLLRLATAGTADMQGASLSVCASQYLGLELDKTGEDDEGKKIRTGFGQYLHCPESIPEAHIRYLVGDITATYMLFGELNRRLTRVWRGISMSRPFGFVDEQHLRSAWSQFGPLTHGIQIKASIVLKEVTGNGLCVDQAQLEPFRKQLETDLIDLREQMLSFGYRPGSKGCKKALQQILRNIEIDNPGIVFPRTGSGYISESARHLEEYADKVPFLSIYLRATEIEKLLSTFIGKMGRGVLHPEFDILKNTGRTSAFGDISAQNLPRDERIRALFVPSPGRVFIVADYAAIEMATLAQALLSQFGGHSKMAEAINAGIDLHRLVASRLTGKPESEITKDERQKAKAVNFGLPGGMGVKTLRQYAKTNYGVDLTELEAERLTGTWFDLFPEMRQFLGKSNDNFGEGIARLLQINCADYALVTGQDINFWADKIGMLGWMARKVFLEELPRTGNGREYAEAERDYFWGRLGAIIDRLPAQHQQAVTNRMPSKALVAAVSNLVGQAGTLTQTGRLRADATYCAQHNTIFQGLAADGAKLAMWKLWRNGFRIVNFIHDEFLIEVPERSNHDEAAETIKRLMIEGMQEVVPNVRINVEGAVSCRWNKDVWSSQISVT